MRHLIIFIIFLFGCGAVGFKYNEDQFCARRCKTVLTTISGVAVITDRPGVWSTLEQEGRVCRCTVEVKVSDQMPDRKKDSQPKKVEKEPR